MAAQGEDNIAMSKRKHPEGETVIEAGAQGNGNASKRRKRKDKGIIEVHREEETSTPASKQNGTAKEDRKSKKRKQKKINGAVKGDGLENGGPSTLPSSEVRVASVQHPSAVANLPTTEIQLSAQNGEKKESGSGKKHKKRRRGQGDEPQTLWTKLEAVGGLMMDLDPVFSPDEEYDCYLSLFILALTVTGIY